MRLLGTILAGATALGLMACPVPASSAPSAAVTPPSIGVVSPTAGPPKGGNVVTISGHRLGAVTAVAFGSARSTEITRQSATTLEVRAPAHSAGTVRLHVVSAHTRSASSVKYSYGPPPRLSFSGPTRVTTPKGFLYKMSCPTNQFCAAVDHESDDLVVVRSGKPPFRTTAAELGTENGNYVEITAVACGTASFCIAENRIGGASFWNGTNWTPFPQGNNPIMGSVSCVPGTTMCVATGQRSDQSVVYHGSSATVVQAPHHGILGAVSCATTTFCMSASSQDSFIFDGSSWHESGVPTGQDPNLDLVELTCPADTFCILAGTVSYQTHLSRFDGTHWHKLANPRRGTGPVCATSTNCVMEVDGKGATFYHGHGFGPIHSVPRGAYGELTCVPNGSCVVINGRNQMFRHTRSGWSSGVTVSPLESALTDVSCPSTSWCMAVDLAGNTFQGAGSQWTSPKEVDGDRPFSAVSCASIHVCVAVDVDGYAVIYRSGVWSAPQRIDGNRRASGLVDVDCPTTSRCVAVDLTGHVISWDGTKWSAPHRHGTNFRHVSCPTRTMCLLVGATPMMVDHGHWSKVALPGREPYLASVTCVRKDYCVASGGLGFYVWHDRTWSRPVGHIANGTDGYQASVVGCTSESACIGKEEDDEGPTTVVFAGAAWERGGGAGGMQAISCVPDKQCVAAYGAYYVTTIKQKS
jgi:hypothetical protein